MLRVMRKPGSVRWLWQWEIWHAVLFSGTLTGIACRRVHNFTSCRAVEYSKTSLQQLQLEQGPLFRERKARIFNNLYGYTEFVSITM